MAIKFHIYTYTRVWYNNLSDSERPSLNASSDIELAGDLGPVTNTILAPHTWC